MQKTSLMFLPYLSQLERLIAKKSWTYILNILARKLRNVKNTRISATNFNEKKPSEEKSPLGLIFDLFPEIIKNRNRQMTFMLCLMPPIFERCLCF